jgi:H+-transporting ATPase
MLTIGSSVGLAMTSEHVAAAPSETTSATTSVAAVLQKEKTSRAGLSSAEAAQRLAQYGSNTIADRTESKWHKLAAYFWGPLPFLIEAAAIISALRRDWADFAVVTGLLIYNAVVGFWQDNKAANALAALKKGLALRARVSRDGKWDTINASDLVPGDVVEIAGGQVVPADVVLIDGEYLSCDQAALTGESLPVSKKVGDKAYSGSIAKQGSMTGVVTATGSNTFFGRTAKLVGSAGAVSHSQRAVTQVGDFLLLLALVLAAILVGVQGYRLVLADDWSWSEFGSVAQYVLVLLIASIPVALPAVMSVTMAIGAYALSLKKAIVSRLSAIEELAGVDILCSDKTGTLTMNQLTVQSGIPFGSAKADDVLRDAALATQKSSQDAIDVAILKATGTRTDLQGIKQTAFVPFDPVNKRTISTVMEPGGQVRHYAKGAPQAIASLAKPDAGLLERYKATVTGLAEKGYRALGVGRSDDGNAWEIVGLVSLMDPPRPDAKATIAEAKALGLNVKMVTGDDVAIGDQIAAQLGIGDHLLVASDVFGAGDGKTASPNSSVVDAVERADGFARVFPEHKYEIVKTLQSRGHIVAMTGDGVNDAPALKQADCGIAVSGATDAARSAAALILTAPGLSTIINAIRVSRQIFERIESYVYYRIAMTLDIMVLVVASVVFFEFQPITAIMIVVLALLDDIPIMTIAYDNVPAPPRPVRWDMHHILLFASFMGLLSVAETFGLLLIGLRWLADPLLQGIVPLDARQLQTVMFLQLAIGGHLLLFVVRTKSFLFRPPYPSARLFWAIVATQIAALIICYTGLGVAAIPAAAIVGVWIYCLLWMVILDICKFAYWFLPTRDPMIQRASLIT